MIGLDTIKDMLCILKINLHKPRPPLEFYYPQNPHVNNSDLVDIAEWQFVTPPKGFEYGYVP